MSIQQDVRRSGATYRAADFRHQQTRAATARVVSEHRVVIENLSDEEIVLWRSQFGEWPPIRIGPERLKRLKAMCTGEKVTCMAIERKRAEERREREARGRREKYWTGDGPGYWEQR